jgi:hypothetical protein
MIQPRHVVRMTANSLKFFTMQDQDIPASQQGQAQRRNGAGERDDASDRHSNSAPAPGEQSERPKEYGGRKGPDPTRYGDWEKNGRCIDF